jgi:hypothetical protein
LEGVDKAGEEGRVAKEFEHESVGKGEETVWEWRFGFVGVTLRGRNVRTNTDESGVHRAMMFL